MKKYLFAMMAVLGMSDGMAQSLQPGSVPSAVRDKVKSMYPGSTVKKWEKEGNAFEAGLVVSGVPTSVVLDAKGTVKEVETTIQPDLLPKEALKRIALEHPGKPISEAAKIVFPSGKVLYEAEIGGKDYMYDSGGKAVKGAQGSGEDGSGEDGSGEEGSGGSGSTDGGKN